MRSICRFSHSIRMNGIGGYKVCRKRSECLFIGLRRIGKENIITYISIQ